MIRYIIEKDSQEATWNIREDGAKVKVGSLTRKGALFTAESESFRTISQGTDPVLALRTVFLTEEFFTERDGELQPLAHDRIRAMVGGIR